MNRALQYLNLLGIAALAALCVLQWRANREVNHEAARLEKTRLEHASKLAEQDKAIHGLTADLDSFREQLVRVHAQRRETEATAAANVQNVKQLTLEQAQLKTGVANWAAAVTARDEQLKRVNEQLRQFAAERNEAVVKFNELTTHHNTVVTELNTRTQDFNVLVAKYNELAQRVEPLQKKGGSQ